MFYVCDCFRQQQFQQVYEEMFDLEQYRWPEPSTVKYEFEIIDENDMEEVGG